MKTPKTRNAGKDRLERLVSCPFCGGSADGAGMNYLHSPDHEYWRIYCTHCGANSQTYTGRACRGWARRAWNRRAANGEINDG